MTTEQQLVRWKRIAAYLASCHAANAERLPKSASMRERTRQASICKKASDWMASEWMEPDYRRPDGEEVRDAIDRCKRSSALANAPATDSTKA